jgi:phospholipid/cholesterol/gamma-HCH transport system substrate-binding protein
MVKRFARPLLVAAVLLAVAGTAGFGFGAPGYTLKLDFTNSDGVVKGADVTIAGVNAGKVESLGVKDKVAVVGVSIDSKFAPLHGGAKAIVRSVGLLGHKYVEIIDGKGGRTLASGSELSIDSTTSPTDLDQFNAIFDAPTREKLRTLTLEGQIALGGRAQVINDDLRQLRNMAVAAEPVVGVVDQHQVALDRATIAFDTLTQKLVREDASLRVLVENGSALLAGVNARDQELAGVLVHGDATFTSLNAALTSNEGNLAGFFARGPSGMTSTDYQLNASIPVIRVTTPILPNLFELLYNMADATTSRDGPGDPHNPNSGTQWNLRVVALPCIQTTTPPATC